MNEPLKIKQILERDGFYIRTPHGNSMWPLLRDHKDVICVVKKPDGGLKRHDVALYIRSNGNYVLHRVMKVKNGVYTMCGDNQTVKEPGITEEQVIGRLDSFYRGEKHYKCAGFLYKSYVFVWCLSLRLRKLLLKIAGFTEGRILKSY